MSFDSAARSSGDLTGPFRFAEVLVPATGNGAESLGAGDPRLLIVDEPTAGLDPEERLRFYRLLSVLAADRTVILSTHIVRDGDQAVTYDKTGFVLWMLLNHMGREPMLAGIGDFFETYHANPDHPVLQDFLGSLRPHAADPSGFDAFTRQWFFEVGLPEYQLSAVRKARDGDASVTTARLTNVGTGKMPVEVAATRGERFPKDDATGPALEPREARRVVTLGAGESAEISIRSDFEPDQLVVDPDAKVLMLRRKAAVAR